MVVARWYLALEGLYWVLCTLCWLLEGITNFRSLGMVTPLRLGCADLGGSYSRIALELLASMLFNASIGLATMSVCSALA